MEQAWRSTTSAWLGAIPHDIWTSWWVPLWHPLLLSGHYVWEVWEELAIESIKIVVISVKLERERKDWSPDAKQGSIEAVNRQPRKDWRQQVILRTGDLRIEVTSFLWGREEGEMVDRYQEPAGSPGQRAEVWQPASSSAWSQTSRVKPLPPTASLLMLTTWHLPFGGLMLARPPRAPFMWHSSLLSFHRTQGYCLQCWEMRSRPRGWRGGYGDAPGLPEGNFSNPGSHRAGFQQWFPLLGQ